MASLDDVKAILANDPDKMFEATWNFPEQCQEAYKLAEAADLLELDKNSFNNIVVTGLGGSAIGGDLLRVFVADKIDIPVIVNRDYDLPNFVDDRTLIFATSFSGNTEETLSAYQQAQKKGAKIVIITTGGKLGEMAKADGVPVIAIPGGMSPRAATGYLFIPTLVVLQRLGMLEGIKDFVNESVQVLSKLREEYKPETPVANNLAKQIAQKFQNKIPVIYGVTGTTEVVATRWKGQINENGKAAAYWNSVPEMNHNEIVGFEQPVQLLREFEVVFIRDKDDHPRSQKRIDISKTIIEPVVHGITEVTSQGAGQLARIFSLTYLGDHISCYLATLYDIDPTPVKMIDKLKKQLVEG